MHGFLNLDKPAGLTSHDCVARVRKLLRLKRVGHGGTLDPSATGVLPIAIGKATRLLQYLTHRKAYDARIRFGQQTTTDDLEGEVITTVPAPDLTLAQVQTHLAQFKGTIAQIPPSYSAIHMGGKRLYDLARAGEVVEAPVRQVEVYDLTVLSWHADTFPELTIAIQCGTGTYIRSIARDLGQCLGIGGTLAALRRTNSSGFDLSTSLSLEELSTAIEAGTFRPIPPTVALAHLPVVTLPTDLARRWGNGQKISSDRLEADWTSSPQQSPAAVVQVHHETGQFLGIGHWIAAPSDGLDLAESAGQAVTDCPPSPQPLQASSDLVLVPKLVWETS